MNAQGENVRNKDDSSSLRALVSLEDGLRETNKYSSASGLPSVIFSISVGALFLDLLTLI